MQETRRFYRFDPTSVRAATRLMRLSCLGRLPLCDLHFYLRQLAMMEPRGRENASRRLGKVALRRAALGHTGVPTVFALERAQRKTLREPHRAGRRISRSVAPTAANCREVEELLRTFRPEQRSGAL